MIFGQTIKHSKTAHWNWHLMGPDKEQESSLSYFFIKLKIVIFAHVHLHFYFQFYKNYFPYRNVCIKVLAPSSSIFDKQRRQKYHDSLHFSVQVLWEIEYHWIVAEPRNNSSKTSNEPTAKLAHLFPADTTLQVVL